MLDLAVMSLRYVRLYTYVTVGTVLPHLIMVSRKFLFCVHSLLLNAFLLTVEYLYPIMLFLKNCVSEIFYFQREGITLVENGDYTLANFSYFQVKWTSKTFHVLQQSDTKVAITINIYQKCKKTSSRHRIYLSWK